MVEVARQHTKNFVATFYKKMELKKKKKSITKNEGVQNLSTTSNKIKINGEYQYEKNKNK